MKIPMTDWEIGPRHQERANYTEQAIAADDQSVSTSPDLENATATGIATFCIGLWQAGFALAVAEPAHEAVTPGIMAWMGRRLCASGNAVALIDVGRRGLRLQPVSSWDIGGNYPPETWQYQIDLPGPSRVTSRRVHGNGLVHVRIGAADATPWLGCGPLRQAGLTSRAIARAETRLGDELGQRTGSLIPHPDDAKKDTLDGLKADLGKMRGNTLLAPTMARNWTASQGAAQSAGAGNDWQPRRLGANVPPGNVEARNAVAVDVALSCGVPPGLVRPDAGGTAARESWRQFVHATIAQYLDVAAEELTDKLETPIRLNPRRLTGGGDLTGRARAYQSLTDAGFDPALAATLTGLE